MKQRSREISVLAAALVGASALLATCARRPLGDEGGEAGAGGRGGGNGGQTAGTSGTICATFEQRSARLPADILILLDASGSMDHDIDDMTCEGGCGARSKWAQASAAINSLVTQTETSVNWGLEWFPDGSLCNLSSVPTVPIAPRNASAIGAAIAGRTNAGGGLMNGGNTPTRTAVDRAARYLSDLADGNPKFILLVTDGGSNCMPGNSSTQADDAAGAVEMVASAKQSGIPTLVVGVTTVGSDAEAAVSAMAVAGGFARVNSAPAYYPVATAAAELTSTYDSLLHVSPDCVFSIPVLPAGAIYPPIGVKLDGIDVPRDTSHTNGWDFTDDTFKALRVYGAACADVIAGKVETVSIVFYCPAGD